MEDLERRGMSSCHNRMDEPRQGIEGVGDRRLTVERALSQGRLAEPTVVFAYIP